MSLLISYPCRGRPSINERINSSALPFFNSRSNIVLFIDGIATCYAATVPCQAKSSGEFGSAVAVTALEAWEAEALTSGLPVDIFTREAEGSLEDMANIFTGIQQLRHAEGEKHLLLFSEFGLLFPFGSEVYDDYIANYAADARVAINIFQAGGLDGLVLRSPSYNKALRRGQPAPSTSNAQG
jgi:hypothetical protein